MQYNAENVFAKVIRGEIPIKKIYENDYAISFYDINPKAKIHALVIPKSMVFDYQDFVEHSTADEISGYNRAIIKTVDILGIKETGYRLIFNTGKDSGQEVMHMHAHILGGEKLPTDIL